MKVLVVGGSGGIGQAIVNQLVSHYPQADVAATYHRNQPKHQQSLVRWYPLDVEDEASIKQLAQQFDQLDWIINCVGMLHTQHQKPEKNLASIDPEFFLKSMAVNCLPTLLIAKHFQPLLRKSAHPCLATVSAKVGSITDNQLGGWYSYRSSKAALNMALKSMPWSEITQKSNLVPPKYQTYVWILDCDSSMVNLVSSTFPEVSSTCNLALCHARSTHLTCGNDPIAVELR